MHKTTIKPEDISLYDLLTVDTHGEIISIENEVENTSYDLIPRRTTFFGPHGLYADVEKNGITLLFQKEKHLIDLADLLKEWDHSNNSCVALIEGFAGCGKSTLVQYILLTQLKTFKYDYSFFNYDLEAQNDLIIHNDAGEVIQRSSIYEAIKKSFFEQFISAIKVNKNVFTDFTYLMNQCRGYQPFDSLFYNYAITDTYAEISSYIDESIEKNEILILKNLWKQTSQISSSICVLALDYLFRLAMYKNRMLEKMYVCYDNLDAIEDATDLKGFDDTLVEFSWLIDKFIVILQRQQFFSGLAKPHFVIIATYRKITAILANIAETGKYREVPTDKYEGIDSEKYIYHIDATSVFSYSRIVAKRKQYFANYFKVAENITQKTKRKLMKELSSWDKLNQTLAIMHDRYSCLWNKNYRTCSLIASELYKKDIYQFSQYVDYIENKKIDDGYFASQDNDGNNILCSYYGGSAILLSSVCKVFHSHHIWDKFLILVPLNSVKPSYKQVSFSRIILTYIYNSFNPVSLEELFNTFCKNKLFPYTKLCRILANMLARNVDGVWRRPIYYSNECILATRAEEIETILLNECEQLSEGKGSLHNYTFVLCDSGRSYVERLMQEFEFFSNRLSNKNKPLYLYNELTDIEAIVNSVYCAVLRCCENMEKFRNEYIKVTGITAEEYLSLPIHPTTNITRSPQLHTERIIFSHIAYLDNVRLYYLNETITPTLSKRQEYNKMFVDSIDRYLNLYYEHIEPVSSKRAFVAEQLSKIVKDINSAIKLGNANPDILFQSISLKNIRNR